MHNFTLSIDLDFIEIIQILDLQINCQKNPTKQNKTTTKPNLFT